jgi:hypothetical protein
MPRVEDPFIRQGIFDEIDDSFLVVPAKRRDRQQDDRRFLLRIPARGAVREDEVLFGFRLIGSGFCAW